MAKRNVPQPVKVGDKFGRWIVVGEEARPTNYPAKYWLCRCDCGTVRGVRQQGLTSGTSSSCGCFQKEDLGRRKLRHGFAAGGLISPEYHSWNGMLDRCRNPKSKGFRNYGARGIKVCERWSVFDNFIADMGPKPSRAHSLDRIDVNGDYEPSNCRWATHSVQSNNKRNTVYVQFRGERRPLGEVAREHAVVDLEIVRCRIDRQGWSLERALVTPKQR